MPVVRVTRQIGTAPLPGVRKTAAETSTSTGAGLEGARANVGEAIAGFGGVVARIGAERYGQIKQEERDHADSVALLEADRRLSEWESSTLYDPTNGALARRGKNALTLPEEIGDGFTKLAGEIEAGLSTDRQRVAFQRVKQQRATSIDLQVKRHVFGEMQRYESEELQGYVANKQSSAIAKALDPKSAMADLADATARIAEHAPRLGFGPEAVKKQIEAVTSGTHVGIIGRLLERDMDGAARAYFEETRSQIAGDAMARVEKAIEEGTLRGNSQKQADAIVTAGGTMKEQLEKVRAIEDPKLQDAVRERVEHAAIIRDREERETKEAAGTSIYNAIERGASLGAIERMPAWQLLSGGERSAASGYLRTRLKGVAVETDWSRYAALMEEAADDPAAFATRNLLADRAKLGDTEFKQLTDLKANIKAGNRKAANADIDAFATKNEMLEDALVLYGVDPKAKPNTDEGRAIAKLRQMLDRRVEAMSSLTGKKPTNEDVRMTLDSLLSVSTQTTGSWWNALPGGQPGPFTTINKPLIRSTIADVPASERPAIEEALRKAKLPVSDTTVFDLWLETKMRQGAQ